GGVDTTVRLWDTATGREALTLRGHTDLVQGVAFSPDGTRLASGGQDGTVRPWEAATRREARTLRGHTGSASSVASSPDGSRPAPRGGTGLPPRPGRPGPGPARLGSRPGGAGRPVVRRPLPRRPGRAGRPARRPPLPGPGPGPRRAARVGQGPRRLRPGARQA